MENENQGSGDKFLDVAAYILAIILWFKTADVMSYFSPSMLNAIFGMDVSFFYGAICATLVEGAALALHFNRRAIRSKSAQIVKWILVGISAMCQVLDGYVSTGNVSQMSDTFRFTLQVGVPLIPIAVLIMLFVIGKLPESDEKPRPFKGIKNMLPSWGRIWNGDGYVPTPDVTLAQDVPQNELKKEEEQQNP